MCGIVGLIRFDGENICHANLNKATNALKKRGPDYQDIWIDKNVGLGHTRLSIIDLSESANQPMHSGDGKKTLIFNGEIYNFQRLKNELADSQYPWRTESDSEVILAAYEKWGVDCLEKFHGMFSFAIWDAVENKLLIARDRMGVKPLYYAYKNGVFVFASRPRAIFLANPTLSKSIDNQALRLFLEVGYASAPLSMFADVKKLPAANYMLLENEKLTINRYWDYRNIPVEESWIHRKEEDLLDELDEVVTNSVKMRLISDVPIGTFLSGGIDSSLVSAISSKLLDEQLETFTIGFKEKAYDESKYAQSVANYLGTNHRCETMGINELLNLMPNFTQEYDEPFFDISAFPTMAVSRLTRNNVTVSLSGDGGDELFGGYSYYNMIGNLQYLYKLPENIKNILSKLIGIYPHRSALLLSSVLKKENSIEAFAFTKSIAKDFKDILDKDVIHETKSISDYFIETAKVIPNTVSIEEQCMRIDAFHTLPELYLQKVDVASMGYSLESREPLLDHLVVEWAMKLPTPWKIRANTNKYLLRKLAYRYIPENILNRPKQGFGVPIDQWLQGPLKKWAKSLLNNPTIYSELPINKEAVKKLFDLLQSGEKHVYPQLWAVLALLNYFCNQNGIEYKAQGH